VPQPGIDSDSDGLSDQEEKEVFGTNPGDPNTDKDSFVDLNEALNLFDPSTPSPAMLKDNPLIAQYGDAKAGIALLRPKAWAQEGPAADGTVSFTAPTGERVRVTVKPKPADQPLLDWYATQAAGTSVTLVETFQTRSGRQAALSPDRMTAYVELGDKVATLVLDLGKAQFLQYRVTFQVMVQSVEIGLGLFDGQSAPVAQPKPAAPAAPAAAPKSAAPAPSASPFNP
jgi:hypothetical protein